MTYFKQDILINALEYFKLRKMLIAKEFDFDDRFTNNAKKEIEYIDEILESFKNERDKLNMSKK